MADAQTIRKLLADINQDSVPSSGEIASDVRGRLLAAAKQLVAALQDVEEEAWRFALSPSAHSCALLAWKCNLLGQWPKETMTCAELATHLNVDQLLIGE
jgi:hypothetical protein